MSLSYESLEAFVTASETGSFTSAAKKLKKAQSTVSTLISNLEVHWDLTLFDRSGKYPVLTDNGITLLDDARLILARLKGLNSRADLMAGVSSAKLTLVSDELMPMTDLATLAKQLAEQFPNTEFHSILKTPETAIGLLENRQADVAIGSFSGIQASSWIDISQIGTQRFITIVSPDHPLAQVPYITEEVLSRYRQIRLTRSITAYPGVLRWYTNSYYTMMRLAIKGVGWTRIPEGLLMGEFISTDKYVVLDGDDSVKPQKHPFQIAIRKDSHPCEVTRWLINFITKQD